MTPQTPDPAATDEGEEGGVVLTLHIENYYIQDAETVVTTPTATVPNPVTEDGCLFVGEELDAWAEEHIMPLTGTGRTKGDAAYFVTVASSSNPALVGAEFEFGL